MGKSASFVSLPVQTLRNHLIPCGCGGCIGTI